MNLRQYQSDFIQNLAIKSSQERRICAQLATGGGKTVIFSSVSDRFLKKSGGSILILVHRKELMIQTRKTLWNMCSIDSFLIAAGVKYIPPAKVYIGMVESVNRRLPKIKNISLVIIDEAHIATFNKLHKVFTEQRIIGFTATPYSNNKKDPMINYYQDIVCGPSIRELIKEGFLAQNITRCPKDIVDRSNLSVEGGDFADDKMAIEFSKPKFIHNTVEAYQRWCKGEKTIVFNVNMEHSKAVNQAFIDAGYNAKYLDSTMTATERTNILRWFETTQDAILNNVGIATVGFDEPTIRNVIVNKATMSMPLWIQMAGRGGRITQFKSSFNIIDMGGNATVHGDWSDDRDWEAVFKAPPKKSSKEGIAPCKTCPKCEGLVHASVRECQLLDEFGELCGHIFPEKATPIEVTLQDFVVVTKDIDVEKIMLENSMKKEYYTFFKIGKDLSKKAKATITEMSDEYFNFILEKYFELGREWTKKYREKYKLDPSKKSIKFNDWHKETAKAHLFKELQASYPKWVSQIEIVTTQN